MLNFRVRKVTPLDGYRVVEESLLCKEDWLFQAVAMGFDKEESPSRAYIEHISENYPSARFYRKFYISESNNRFEEICGVDVIFGVRKEATAFVKELKQGLQ